MKSLFLFAILSIVISLSCNQPKKEVKAEPAYGKFQKWAKNIRHINDALLFKITSRGYLPFYEKALLFFKYRYLQCHCYGYDNRVYSMNDAQFMLSNFEEKYDTIWHKPDTIIKLSFNFLVADSIQCEYGAKLNLKSKKPLRSIDTHYTLIYGLSFSKKDTSLLQIYNYDCGSATPVQPNKKWLVQFGLERLEKFKLNRQYADDTLNYLFEKYKNDSIIYY